jgi:hypothetical protein
MFSSQSEGMVSNGLSSPEYKILFPRPSRGFLYFVRHHLPDVPYCKPFFRRFRIPLKKRRYADILLQSVRSKTGDAQPSDRSCQKARGMSGLQEILVIVLILLGVLYLPRRAGRENGGMRRANAPATMSGRMRLGIVLSVLWPVGVAFYLKPWQGDPMLFAGVGLLPAAAGWAAAWVIRGYRRRR